MNQWREVSPGLTWERIDGASVMWDQRSPYPDPANPNSRMWTAWEPNPSMAYLKRGEEESGRPGRVNLQAGVSSALEDC